MSILAMLLAPVKSCTVVCTVQDISERYPAWIESNRPLLSGEEVSRYEEQLEHINRVCDLLETHGDSRFDELLQLLQEVCCIAWFSTTLPRRADTAV